MGDTRRYDCEMFFVLLFVAFILMFSAVYLEGKDK